MKSILENFFVQTVAKNSVKGLRRRGKWETLAIRLSREPSRVHENRADTSCCQLYCGMQFTNCEKIYCQKNTAENHKLQGLFTHFKKRLIWNNATARYDFKILHINCPNYEVAPMRSGLNSSSAQMLNPHWMKELCQTAVFKGHNYKQVAV